ncbi:acetyl-CoA synthetase-like protein [Ramaria rubella]|nr:acetyl-CoA synthetase-like protein [Ramaria rubella]
MGSTPISSPHLATCLQGVKVKDTFTPPPFDNTLPYNDLIDWHMDHSPNHRYATLTPCDAVDGGKVMADVTYAELGEKVHTLGKTFLDAIPEGPIDSQTSKPRVIGLIVDTDVLVYDTIILAAMRAGFVPFPISTRNDVPALVNLLAKSNCCHIISVPASQEASASPKEQSIYKVLQILESEHNQKVTVLPIPKSQDLFPRLHANPIGPYVANQSTVKRLQPLATHPLFQGFFTGDKVRKLSDNWPAIMIHSSGSTSLPKPIVYSQKLAYTWSTWTSYGELDVSGLVFAGFMLPAFHAIGVCGQLTTPLANGVVIALWLPGRAPPAPTAQNLVDTILWTKSKLAIAHPIFIEQWSKDPVALEKLKQLDILSWGGAPLSKEAGDAVVKAGINFQMLYGMAEGGHLFKGFLKEPLGNDWQYGSWVAYITPKLVELAPNLYRLELKANENHLPATFNVPGERTFNTNDLIEEHPTKKGYYRVLGRVEDQLIMSAGGIIDALPLVHITENIIRTSPLINNATILGQGLPAAGILVEPTRPPPSDSEAYITSIWPYIERANVKAPKHAQIQRELVIIGDPVERAIPITVKGNNRRHEAVKMYATEIAKAYAAFRA